MKKNLKINTCKWNGEVKRFEPNLELVKYELHTLYTYIT